MQTAEIRAKMRFEIYKFGNNRKEVPFTNKNKNVIFRFFPQK